MNTQKNFWLIEYEQTDLLSIAKLLSKQLGQFTFLMSVCENFHHSTSLPILTFLSTYLVGVKGE